MADLISGQQSLAPLTSLHFFFDRAHRLWFGEEMFYEESMSQSSSAVAYLRDCREQTVVAVEGYLEQSQSDIDSHADVAAAALAPYYSGELNELREWVLGLRFPLVSKADPYNLCVGATGWLAKYCNDAAAVTAVEAALRSLDNARLGCESAARELAECTPIDVTATCQRSTFTF